MDWTTQEKLAPLEGDEPEENDMEDVDLSDIPPPIWDIYQWEEGEYANPSYTHTPVFFITLYFGTKEEKDRFRDTIIDTNIPK